MRKAEVISSLLEALALQMGSEVSYQELAQLLKIDQSTVTRYIDLLEKSFVIFRLRALSRNVRNEIAGPQGEEATKKEVHTMSGRSSEVPQAPQNMGEGGKASLQPKRTPVTDREIEAVMVCVCLSFSFSSLSTLFDAINYV